MLVGFWLIITVTAAYAQTQKPMVDLNTASEKELESIKGVGPATAKKIIAGRPYSSVNDLSKAGVPAKTIEGMKPYVTVGKPAAALPAPAEKKPTTPPAAAKPETPPAPVKAAAPAAATKGAAQEPNQSFGSAASECCSVAIRRHPAEGPCKSFRSSTSQACTRAKGEH